MTAAGAAAGHHPDPRPATRSAGRGTGGDAPWAGRSGRRPRPFDDAN